MLISTVFQIHAYQWIYITMDDFVINHVEEISEEEDQS